MRSSTNNLAFIRPKAAKSSTGIEAWFTLKNAHHRPENASITGLNLGFNTPEDDNIIEQNRSLMCEKFNIDQRWIAYATQVHSNRIQVVSQGGTYASTDGLITQIPELALAIQVADCAAVLCWDTEHRVIGAFHAGWRGASGDIVPKGINVMINQGAGTSNLRAFISPCISQQNFEVGSEVAEQFPATFVDNQTYRKPHLDLKGFLKAQLTQQGLRPDHIEVHPGCTIEDSKRYYSYRREGCQSGRMMGLIKLSEQSWNLV